MIVCKNCGAQNTDIATSCRVCGVELPGSTQTMAVPKTKTHVGLIVVIVVVLLVGLLGGSGGWYYFYGPCGVNRVNSTADQLQQIARRWDDSMQLANSTPRIALAGPVATLQSAERDTETTDVPSCLNNAHELLTQGMKAAISGFVAFMAQKSDADVQESFNSYQSDLSLFGNELTRVRKCAPFCS